MKCEYPINLVNETNECILHTIYDNYNNIADNERTKAFISFVITSTDFKHLNLKRKSIIDITPLYSAILNKRHIDIIKFLLDNGSVIFNPAKLDSQYPTLNIFQNYVTLQSLAANVIVNNNNTKRLPLPRLLQKFVDCYR